MQNLKDQETLEGIASGNQTVINQFYIDHFKYIRGFILQNSGTLSDVEDVFQDALMILYQKVQSNSFVLESSLRTFFFAICRNLWFKKIRRFHKEKLTEFHAEEIDLLDSDIVEIMELTDRYKLYRKYFLKLSQGCKDLLLKVFNEKSLKEIAKENGNSEGYIRKKKHHCKKALIENIEKDPLYTELTHTFKEN